MAGTTCIKSQPTMVHMLLTSLGVHLNYLSLKGLAYFGFQIDRCGDEFSNDLMLRLIFSLESKRCVSAKVVFMFIKHWQGKAVFR